jgi:RHS repeat-associated protein
MRFIERLRLFYMQARWYDAAAGTFLTVDPVVGDARDPQQLNAYNYGRNNPVGNTDPTGMWCLFFVFGSHCGQDAPTWSSVTPVTPPPPPPSQSGNLDAFSGGGAESLAAATFAVALTGAEEGAPFGPWGVVAGIVIGIGTMIGTDLLAHGPIYHQLHGLLRKPQVALQQQSGDDGDVVIDDKIKGQLGDRGWTEQEVRDAANGPPAGTSTGNRGGRNEPATVYGSPDGYVVVNDATREVVQVSDRNPGSGWIPDNRINWGR